MSYVYAGSRLTYVGNWNETGVLLWTSGVSDLLAQVAADLKNQYELIIESSNVQAPAIAIGHLTETITLKIYSGMDRNDILDIQGNIDDSFARFAQRPDSSSIPSVTTPQSSGGNAHGTGAPGAPVPDASSNVLSWWEQFKAQAEGASVGLLIGIVATGSLLIYIAVHE